MHIAFLTSEYPHSRIAKAAGIGTSIKNLVSELVSNNIEVSVFVYGEKEDAVFKENGVTFHMLKQIKYSFFGWYLYRKYIANYLNLAIEEHSIDLVEAPDWTGITAFMKLKAPLIIRLHGTDAYFCNLEGRIQKKKNFWLEKSALKRADAIVSVSNFTGKKTKEIFKLKKDITTLYNGVALDQFNPKDVEVVSNSLLYFGTVIRKKGILDLAKAFTILRKVNFNAQLTIIGKDTKDYLTRESTLSLFYNEISEEDKEFINYKDHMPYKEVVMEIAKAAVVVLPSHAEAFPMTWLEAMAMEKALVTSNIGWANELMIHEETGFMVDPNKHEKLAEYIEILLSSEEKRKQFGRNARSRIIENFSTEEIAKKNIAFYTSVAG